LLPTELECLCGHRKRQIKANVPDKEVIIIAGNEKEGNYNARAKDASFSQLMGICFKLDKNIIVTDAQRAVSN